MQRKAALAAEYKEQRVQLEKEQAEELARIETRAEAERIEREKERDKMVEGVLCFVSCACFAVDNPVAV